MEVATPPPTPQNMSPPQPTQTYIPAPTSLTPPQQYETYEPYQYQVMNSAPQPVDMQYCNGYYYSVGPGPAYSSPSSF